MPAEEEDTLCVVVLVESGIPVRVEAYRRQAMAQRRERELRRELREDYDAVGVFDVVVGQRSDA